MRRAGLTFRFILLTSILILATSALIGALALWSQSAHEKGEIEGRGISLARNFSFNSELGILTRNRALLQELAAGIFQEREVVHLRVRDLSGEVLLEESREGFDHATMQLLRDPDEREMGAGVARVSELASTPGTRAEFIEVSYPVFTRRGDRANEEIGFLLEETEGSEGKLEAIGQVSIALSLAENYAEIARLRTGFGLLTLGVFLVGVLLTSLLVRIVLRPIRELVGATRRIASGSLDERVEEGSTDELGDLARSFNQMTGELRKSRHVLENYSAGLEEQVQLRTRELEDAQSQLVQAEKMSAVGLLVSGVAHELNNPLAGVVGFSQLLLKEEVREKVRRGLERINREAERCKKIVQNLQTFARKHTPQKEYVGINGILEACVDLRAYQLRVDNIKVDMDLQQDLPKTMADFHQLQQVIINILVNGHQAMLASGEGGTLCIRSREEDGRIRITIRDSGPGIPGDVLAKVFDPFFTTKDVGEGTGLGLSICYGIMEEHRGSIAARNAPEGGAEFTLELPILAPEEEEPLDEKEESEKFMAAMRGCGNILVVDDELTILDILHQFLREEGHRVDTAMSGNIALRKIEKERYDVIISDLKMPGMSGQELYEMVRRVDEEMAARIIFATGDVVSPDTQEFLKSTGNRYLQKPFELEAIRREVVATLRTEVLESVTT